VALQTQRTKRRCQVDAGAGDVRALGGGALNRALNRAELMGIESRVIHDPSRKIVPLLQGVKMIYSLLL
jgi:hypothetical protein